MMKNTFLMTIYQNREIGFDFPGKIIKTSTNRKTQDAYDF